MAEALIVVYTFKQQFRVQLYGSITRNPSQLDDVRTADAGALGLRINQCDAVAVERRRHQLAFAGISQTPFVTSNAL